MRYAPIDSKLFVENRDRLKKLMQKNSLAILNANDVQPTNADGTMGFRQNSDLFYMTGVDQEETVLMIYPDAFEEKHREILFVRRTNDLIATWEGHKLTKEEATEVSGVKTVMWTSEFPRMFRQAMCDCENVYLNSNEHKRATIDVETRDMRFVADCLRQFPLHHYHRLTRLMQQLRIVKTQYEIDLMRKACAITKAGFERVAKFVKPGVNEMEIEAEFAHEFIRRGGGFAYGPIIGSGKNNCVLHYVDNNQVCRKNDLLLLDVASSYANYQSDLTRTIPISGRFSRRHKQVYNAVLRVMRESAKLMVPGKLMKDVQKEAEKMVENELLELGLLKKSEVKKQDPEKPALKKYFMHGLGHLLGLDVHDVGYTNQPIAPGWILTCEPGIYIPDEGFGIRLENDILVTESGPVDLMADIPVEADEIEELMARRK